MHRSPGICPTAEENLRKPQLGDRLMKGLATSHRLNWGPFPPKMLSLRSRSTSGWEKDGIKKRTEAGSGIPN